MFVDAPALDALHMHYACGAMLPSAAATSSTATTALLAAMPPAAMAPTFGAAAALGAIPPCLAAAAATRSGARSVADMTAQFAHALHALPTAHALSSAAHALARCDSEAGAEGDAEESLPAICAVDGAVESRVAVATAVEAAGLARPSFVRRAVHMAQPTACHTPALRGVGQWRAPYGTLRTLVADVPALATYANAVTGGTLLAAVATLQADAAAFFGAKASAVSCVTAQEAHVMYPSRRDVGVSDTLVRNGRSALRWHLLHARHQRWRIIIIAILFLLVVFAKDQDAATFATAAPTKGNPKLLEITAPQCGCALLLHLVVVVVVARAQASRVGLDAPHEPRRHEEVVPSSPLPQFA